MTTCRVCQGVLISVLDLGKQPLANGFRSPSDTTPECRYPLHLLRCPDCELVQLSTVVDPAVLYGPAYPFRSGVTDGWAFHCHELAREIGKGKRVLDIGCLDGVLLRECRDKGCEVQGIDPSAPDSELAIIRERFTRDTEIGHLGTFDVVVAQNVLGHVDDAEGFLFGIKRALHSDGYAVIEAPWIVDLVDGVRWDTIYHEHLSYWGVRPLMRLCQKVGMQVTATRYFPEMHGGTLRYTLRHDGGRAVPNVYQSWDDEVMDEWSWTRFEKVASGQIAHWNTLLQLPRRYGAFGASAKLNTLLNALPERPRLEVVLDDTTEKIGLLTPGWGFPVAAPTPAAFAEIDVLLIGSPNWRPLLEKRAGAMGFEGEIISLWETP